MDQVVCMTSWLRNLHRRAACMGELDADETMIAGLRQAEVEGTRARCAGDEIYRRIDAVAVEHGAREDHPRQTVAGRSEEHTSELQSLMSISYDVFCLTTTHK